MKLQKVDVASRQCPVFGSGRLSGGATTTSCECSDSGPQVQLRNCGNFLNLNFEARAGSRQAKVSVLRRFP